MKTPWHLWVIGVVSLLWNAGGAYDYLMIKTANAAYLEAYSPEQMAYFDTYPLWVSIAWALGVWGAIAGSILLLLRSRFAVTAFALSLLGLLGNTIWGLFISDTPMTALMGDAATSMMLFTAAIFVVAILLWFYAARMRRAGVLG